jgi:phosphopantetheinyl transferase
LWALKESIIKSIGISKSPKWYHYRTWLKKSCIL